LSYGHPEGTLLQVELDAIAVEVGKGFSQIFEQTVSLRGFYNDVVDVDFDIAADLLLQACLHTPLIGGSGILEPEGHRHVAVWHPRHHSGSDDLSFGSWCEIDLLHRCHTLPIGGGF
jgi:hypothetical protein